MLSIYINLATLMKARNEQNEKEFLQVVMQIHTRQGKTHIL